MAVAADAQSPWDGAALRWHDLPALSPWPNPDELRELEGIEPAAASLWHEVRADALSGPDDADQCRFALAAASRHATGIRRATLLRRLADAQLLAGQPDAAIVTLQPIGRVLNAQPLPASPHVQPVLARLEGAHTAADDWATLDATAALAFVELARAEALSHLIKRDEAMAGFADVERRAQRVEGPAAAQLWVRWAKAQTWFLCEILGDARAALDVCARVRQRVPSQALTDDAHAIALLRAEEIASTSAGDFNRGRTLVEEQIALAQKQRNVREECLAWNARGLIHFGEGELMQARTALSRAVELSLSARWARREAISTHNLALIAVELLQLDEALQHELHYQALSVTIGNEGAKAEAPLVLASVELARGNLAGAEVHISHARKAAESGGWVMLIALARALQGRLHLARFVADHEQLELPKARTHLLAAVDSIEEHSVAWSEELDPGETYALLALAHVRSGQLDKARALLDRATTRIPKQNVLSHQTLALGRAVTGLGSLTDALGWFDARGFHRIVALWRTLAG